MSDFVIGFPQKPYTHQAYTCSHGTDEASVATFGTSRVPHCISKSPDLTVLDMNPKSHMSREDDRDYVLDMVSEKQFSKERITEIVKRSVVSLIETLLTGRNVYRIDGDIQVSLRDDKIPISISLCENYNVGSGCGYEAEQGFNIRLRESVSPPGTCVRLHSPEGVASERDRVDCAQSPPRDEINEEGKQTRSYAFGDHVAEIRPGDRLSPDTEEVKARRDSDEESGYNSNTELGHRSPRQVKKDAPESEVPSCFGQVYPVECCMDESPELVEQRFSDKREPSLEKVESAKSPESLTTDMDDGGNSPLVIDLSADNSEEPAAKLSDSTSRFSGMTSDADVKLARVQDDAVQEGSDEDLPSEQEEKSHVEQEHAAHKDGEHCCHSVTPARCLPEESEDVETEHTSSSDVTDFETDLTETDVGVEASGDNEAPKTTLVTPHPQSIISKLPTGFLCKHCRQILPDAESVSSHAFEHHNLFSCSFCFRTFTAKNNLKRHIRLHTGLRPYKCPHCPRSFARRDDLKGHMLRHDYSKPFRCAVCKKGYTDRACVKNHMAKEHGSRLMHVCPQCGESFDNDDAFSAHKKSHPELKQFSCKVCYFIGNNNLMTMKHSLIHEHSLFSCKPCNAFFADPFDYTNHVRKHKSNSNFTSYVCCFCKMTLSSYEQFVRHEYSHAQGKTYSCKTCKKQFKSKASMQEHALSHVEQTTEHVNCCEVSPLVSKMPVSEEEVTEENHPEMAVASTCHSSPSLTDNVVPPQNTHESIMDLTANKSAAYPFRTHDMEEDALDLSVKKPPKALMELSLNGQDATATASRFCPSPKPAELSRYCVPRNGCTSEFAGNETEAKSDSYEHSAYEAGEYLRRSNTHTRVPDFFEKLPQSGMMWTRKEQNFSSSVHGEGNTERQTSRRDEFRHKMLARSMSGGHGGKSPCRASPYSRNKVMDFASKFLAARGPLASLPKGLAPRNGASPPHEPSPGTGREALLRWQSQERRISSGNGLEHRQVESEVANTDRKTDSLLCTALTAAPGQFPITGPLQKRTESPFTSQLPTFIKSEPMFEGIHQTERGDSPPQQRLPRPVATPAGASATHMGDSDTKGAVVSSTSGHSSKVHECDLCKDVFPSFQELENHSVAVHKRYLCEHCGKNFTARPNRDRHVRYHTGERPYKCDLCDQAFFRGDDLKYHRTTRHPSAQPFVCPRCPATFTWSRDLERHIRQSKCKV